MDSKKIKEAIKNGKLISFEDVLRRYSDEDRKEIEVRARYYMARSKVRKLRKTVNLTQTELARKMNVKREFISRIESGNQNITLETLIRIASAVGKEFKFSFK